MRSEKVSVLIVGAGVIGSALALHLAKLGVAGVRVIDPDLEGPLSSSELNAGGVRATMEQSINIELSRLSIEYFESVADQVGFRSCGYLWLRSGAAMPAAERLAQKQIAAGWAVDTWELEQVRERYPFLDRLDGVVAAHLGRRDGLINPNLLKLHYRDEARRLGVVFDDRTVARSFDYAAGGVKALCSQWSADHPEDARYKKADLLLEESDLMQAGTPAEADMNSSSVVYHADRVVNCAGPWASRIARSLGYVSPSFPLRRMISLFESRDVDLSPYGMVVDTSGVYFHPEATFGLAGVATPEAPGFNFDYPGPSFFEESIWPALYERSSGFERLKHKTGWAGLYEVSPDHSAIIGRVELGEAGKSQRVFECHSFSGHGVMQSYAVGLALAEQMVFGEAKLLDLGLLNGNRFESGPERWVVEGAVI